MSESFQEPEAPLVSIFPDDETEVTGAEALADAEAALLDAPTTDDDLVIPEEEPPPYARSWAMDFTVRNFQVPTGGHGPLETRGLSTLTTWIEKCLRTQVGAHPVHPDGYGIDLPYDLVGQPVETNQAATLYQRIEEALLFHPRITEVTDFESDFDPDDEWISVGFTVHTDRGDNVEMTLVLP